MYVLQSRDAVHTRRANGEKNRGRKRGEIRQDQEVCSMLNTPLKLRTWLEREGNRTKLLRVHISLSRLLALRHR